MAARAHACQIGFITDLNYCTEKAMGLEPYKLTFLIGNPGIIISMDTRHMTKTNGHMKGRMLASDNYSMVISALVVEASPRTA